MMYLGRWLQLTFFSFLCQNAVRTFCTRRRSFGYCQNFPRLKKNEKGEPSDLTFWGGQKVEHFFSPFLDPLPVYEFL